MKGLGIRVPRSVSTGTRLTCADNTGARVVQVVSVFGYHGVRRRQPKLGLADIATVSVKKGTPDMRRKLVRAVVIRQKKRSGDPADFGSVSMTTLSWLSMRRTNHGGLRSRVRSPVRLRSGTRVSDRWPQSSCEWCEW